MSAPYYRQPSELNYETDVDPVGRDMIKQINETDYIRTTMYCSGHFRGEQRYPHDSSSPTRVTTQLDLRFVALDAMKVYNKISELKNKIYAECFWRKLRIWGGYLTLYVDKDDNDKQYMLGHILIRYYSKAQRAQLVEIIKSVLN